MKLSSSALKFEIKALNWRNNEFFRAWGTQKSGFRVLLDWVAYPEFRLFSDNCIKSWPSERCFKVGATLLGAFMQSLMVKHTTNIFQRTLFPSRVNNLTGFTQRERAAVTLKSFVLNWYTCRLARLVHLTKCHVITCNSTAPYGCLL